MRTFPAVLISQTVGKLTYFVLDLDISENIALQKNNIIVGLHEEATPEESDSFEALDNDKSSEENQIERIPTFPASLRLQTIGQAENFRPLKASLKTTEKTNIFKRFDLSSNLEPVELPNFTLESEPNSALPAKTLLAPTSSARPLVNQLLSSQDVLKVSEKEGNSTNTVQIDQNYGIFINWNMV